MNNALFYQVNLNNSNHMNEAERPLCLLLQDDFGHRRELTDDILKQKILPALGLDQARYFQAFRQLRDYWGKYVPGHGDYLLCAALQLKKVLHTPEQWLESGKHLADAAASVYGRGSHQFVENAVPGLIDGGLVTTDKELDRGVDILVAHLPRSRRNGADLFDDIAVKARGGIYSSLDDLSDRAPL